MRGRQTKLVMERQLLHPRKLGSRQAPRQEVLRQEVLRQEVLRRQVLRRQVLQREQSPWAEQRPRAPSSRRALLRYRLLVPQLEELRQAGVHHQHRPRAAQA